MHKLMVCLINLCIKKLYFNFYLFINKNHLSINIHTFNTKRIHKGYITAYNSILRKCEGTVTQGEKIKYIANCTFKPWLISGRLQIYAGSWVLIT